MILKIFLSFLVSLLLSFTLRAVATPTSFVLYDASKQPVIVDKYLPKWLLYANTGGTQSWQNSPPGTVLDTLPELDIVDGYSNYGGLHLFNPDFPKLNRSKGYQLNFTVEIMEEEHNRPERAGFSVILLSQDVNAKTTTSLEIGFQKNRIFLQNEQPLFGRKAAQENLSFNPVGVGLVDYVLEVKDDRYSLRTGNRLILQGKLQNYTKFVGLLNPYRFPSFVFLGDDTTSAGAKIGIKRVVLQLTT
jgi:hypothetical protein